MRKGSVLLYDLAFNMQKIRILLKCKKGIYENGLF